MNENFNNEVWKDIEGFEGKYQVSNCGRVRSLDYRNTGKVKLLQPQKDADGYMSLNLWSHQKYKRIRVHRAVAQAFIPNPNNLPIVNHKDENPSNNNVDNLEWCTSRYNNTYGERMSKVASKLKVPVLNVETGEIYPSAIEAATATGAEYTGIRKCINGKRKTSGGYHWERVA